MRHQFLPKLLCVQATYSLSRVDSNVQEWTGVSRLIDTMCQSGVALEIALGCLQQGAHPMFVTSGSPKFGSRFKVLGICRISTEHQREESLKDQEQLYRRKLDELYSPHRYELRIISSRGSGERLDSPALLEAMELINSGDFDLERLTKRVLSTRSCSRSERRRGRGRLGEVPAFVRSGDAAGGTDATKRWFVRRASVFCQAHCHVRGHVWPTAVECVADAGRGDEHENDRLCRLARSWAVVLVVRVCHAEAGFPPPMAATA